MNEKVIVTICISSENDNLEKAIEEIQTFTKQKYTRLISVGKSLFKHEFHDLYNKNDEHVIQLLFNVNDHSRESINLAYLGFVNSIEKEKFNYCNLLAADERFFHYYEF